MPSAAIQRSSPSTLTTIDSTSIRAMLVARNSRMRFMGVVFSFVGLLDQAGLAWFQDLPSAFFSNDIRWGIGIARSNAGEYRGVDDPQPSDASYPQLVVDHRQRIVAHFAGSHGVEDGSAKLARRARQFIVIRNGWPGAEFLRLVLGQRLGGHDAPREAHAFHRHPAVFVGRQVVEPDFRMVVRVFRPYFHKPP